MRVPGRRRCVPGVAGASSGATPAPATREPFHGRRRVRVGPFGGYSVAPGILPSAPSPGRTRPPWLLCGPPRSPTGPPLTRRRAACERRSLRRRVIPSVPDARCDATLGARRLALVATASETLAASRYLTLALLGGHRNLLPRRPRRNARAPCAAQAARELHTHDARRRTASADGCRPRRPVGASVGSASASERLARRAKPDDGRVTVGGLRRDRVLSRRMRDAVPSTERVDDRMSAASVPP